MAMVLIDVMLVVVVGSGTPVSVAAAASCACAPGTGKASRWNSGLAVQSPVSVMAATIRTEASICGRMFVFGLRERLVMIMVLDTDTTKKVIRCVATELGDSEICKHCMVNKKSGRYPVHDIIQILIAT